MSEQQDWQTAFLRQARVDWNAYRRTSQAAWVPCHRLYFLQSATEKLGKALLVAGHVEFETVTHSHTAFVKFMRIVSNNSKLREMLGMRKTQLRTHFKQLLPLAYEIELLAPALAHGQPNPEYPWADATGKIIAPGDYDFPLTQKLQRTPRGIRLLRYIEITLLRFEELFI